MNQSDFVMLLTCTRELNGSNLGRDTSYPELFVVLPSTYWRMKTKGRSSAVSSSPGGGRISLFSTLSRPDLEPHILLSIWLRGKGSLLKDKAAGA